MIEHTSLLRSAAGQIDELDAQIAALNDDKKAVYQNIKETVPPADFKAWKDAVKLRQKRRVDRDSLEAHEDRVTDMLHMLEQDGTPLATRAPAGARDTDPSPSHHGEGAGEAGEVAAAASPAEPHDPETGEVIENDNGYTVASFHAEISRADALAYLNISETPSPAPVAVPRGEEAGAAASLAVPASTEIDLTLPAFLDRRRMSA